MSLELVKLSLEKILKDNITNTYFTTDSKFSEAQSITNLYSANNLD